MTNSVPQLSREATRGAKNAASARDALRSQKYGEALTLIRKTLTSYLASDDPEVGWTPTQHILGSQYARLAAAFEDSETLDLMGQAFEFMSSGDFGHDFSRMKFPAALAGYRADLDAMRALRATVDAAPAGVAVRELSAVTERAKSRLAWMEKVGTVHVIDGVAYPGAAPQVEVAASPTTVPELRAYFPSLDSLETDEQREFYETYARSVHAGEPLDLEGNLTYAFILVREIAARRDRHEAHAQHLERTLQLFAQTHSDDSLGHYSRLWYADLAFLDGDFEEGYRRFGASGPSIELYVNLAPLVADSRVTPEMVDNWLGKGNGLTAYGKKRKQDVAAHLAVILEDLHEELGRSAVMDLWTRLIIDRPRGGAAPFMEDEFGGFLPQDELNSRLGSADASYERRIYEKAHEAFNGMHGLAAPIEWPEWTSAYWFGWIAQERLRALYRRAENSLREAEGLKAVGEGWVSEVALLNELRAAFPDEHIVHQGRPRWLGQQSLDIFFPQRHVAVEYQGLQHSEPVERFGGAEAFVRQQERDERKRALCIEHGVTLIEVHPGYDLGTVTQAIRSALGQKLRSPHHMTRACCTALRRTVCSRCVSDRIRPAPS